MIRIALSLLPAFAAAPVVAAAPPEDGAITAPAGGCAMVAGHRLAGVELAERHERPAAAATATLPALPAHCEILGALDRRTGADGQPYAIRFRLRLPVAWNGRFFFQGGGGSNGVVGDALGNLQGEQSDVALAHGFAVVSQDSGHDNAINDRPDRGGVTSFGWDFAARRDYAFASQARVTEVAKALIAAYYRRAPRFSYFVGCSKGGQEGMAMAERFPTYFDGIIANAPGFALPRAAVAQAYDTQVMARVAEAMGARTADGAPRVGGSFSDGDLGLVATAVLTACDALDGQADGIVAATRACTTARVAPVLAALACQSGKTATCLLPAQIEGIRQVMAGARDAAGRNVYSDWAWDPGIGGTWGGRTTTGWRAWKLGTADGIGHDSRNVLLGAASLATVFTTPPTAVANDAAALLAYQRSLDIGAAEAATRRTAPGFPQSAWALMAANSPDRSAFRLAGGKMIVVHGAADPVFSVNDTIRWWEALDRRERGHAADFTRLFVAPGMGHCRGGPATSRFDAFTALTHWVEQDIAPDRIVATAPQGTPWPGRTRPLCPYPKIARPTGTGSVEDAESFACR